MKHRQTNAKAERLGEGGEEGNREFNQRGLHFSWAFTANSFYTGPLQGVPSLKE